MANCGSVPIRVGYMSWEDTSPNFLGVRCGSFPGFRDPVRRMNVVFSSLCSVRGGVTAESREGTWVTHILTMLGRPLPQFRGSVWSFSGVCGSDEVHF